jgi:excinuclease ABC subunit B
VKRAINESAYVFAAGKNVGVKGVSTPSEELDRGEVILELEREMLEAADNLEFERAAYLRDQIKKLKGGTAAPKGRGRGAGKKTVEKKRGIK